MERIVVNSTNNDPNYKFFVPIMEWAWNKLGWKVATFYTSDLNTYPILQYCNPENYLIQIPEIEGVRTGTLAQVVRHFSANILPSDSYIMLSDIDMLPLSDYWQPDYNAKTIWGHDLTGYGFVPVAYIGMKQGAWYELMGCTGNLAADMEREMKANGRAYREKWEDYWDADWEILTQKVNPRMGEFTKIDRGFVNLAKDATAKGRVDRYDWDKTRNQSNLIDSHLLRPGYHDEYWPKVKELIQSCFGEVPEWMDEYRNKFVSELAK